MTPSDKTYRFARDSASIFPGRMCWPEGWSHAIFGQIGIVLDAEGKLVTVKLLCSIGDVPARSTIARRKRRDKRFPDRKAA